MPRGNKPRHGFRTGELYKGKRPRVYASWVNMRQRCNNSRNPNAKYYSQRFITCCPEWDSFERFLADMGEPPEGMTLERIDNDGDYCKENCRWATRAEQNLNKRNVKRYSHNGRTLTLGQWATESGIQRLTLYHRLKDGCSIEQALTLPLWERRR